MIAKCFTSISSFLKHLNIKTLLKKKAVKKENKYDAGILKTSDRSTNIIFSYPQSRETIPLSRMSNIYRGAILNEIASFFKIPGEQIFWRDQDGETGVSGHEEWTREFKT